MFPDYSGIFWKVFRIFPVFSGNFQRFFRIFKSMESGGLRKPSVQSFSEFFSNRMVLQIKKISEAHHLHDTGLKDYRPRVSVGTVDMITPHRDAQIRARTGLRCP